MKVDNLCVKLTMRVRNLRPVILCSQIVLWLPIISKARKAKWCNRLLDFIRVQYRLDKGKWQDTDFRPVDVFSWEEV